MKSINYLFDSNFDISYVKDSIVWDQIFNKPFPVDIKDPNKGNLILSEYFDNEICKHDSSDEYGQDIRGIITNSIFHSCDRRKRDCAFLVLCSFLKRFKKPPTDLLLSIKNHPEIEPSAEFSPLCLYYDNPTYVSLSEEKNAMRIAFDGETYAKINHYAFNEKIEVPKEKQSLLIPFSSFIGFGIPI